MSALRQTTRRAMRRAHLDQLKARVRHYYSGYARYDDRASGKLARTRTPCSCWMCGNPRRYLGERTMQERRADGAWAEQLAS